MWATLVYVRQVAGVYRQLIPFLCIESDANESSSALRGQSMFGSKRSLPGTE